MITSSPDDFDRPVHCLAGLPFDAVDMAAAVARVRGAAERRERCFLSTPNLNFLVGCLNDAEFRDSVIHSDLNLADGMPLVWMSRLLKIPIPERVPGSGLFEQLRRRNGTPLSVYFFGGALGVAQRACESLNAAPSGIRCAGFESPGFGGIEAMSDATVIARANESGADFLVVALGARKGQAWIEHNRHRLAVPVLSHLGAVVNFAAGTVSRAPQWMQRAGLEWVWRIKEEPSLWRRYGSDGVMLLCLLFARVLPYAIFIRWQAGRLSCASSMVRLLTVPDAHEVRLEVGGTIAVSVPAEVRQILRDAAAANQDVVIDLARADSVSPGFLGLLLVLKKQLDARGKTLRVRGANPTLRRIFYWNCLEYLFDERH